MAREMHVSWVKLRAPTSGLPLYERMMPMPTTHALTEESGFKRSTRHRRRYKVAGAGVGAVCSAVIGWIAAGSSGAIAGVVIGGVMGGMTAWAMRAGAEQEAARDSQLDVEIGVTGADLGVPGLQHPPAKIGAYSKEAAGAASSTESHDADGPITRPPG